MAKTQDTVTEERAVSTVAPVMNTKAKMIRFVLAGGKTPKRGKLYMVPRNPRIPLVTDVVPQGARPVEIDGKHCWRVNYDTVVRKGQVPCFVNEICATWGWQFAIVR